ncbi:MAG: UDP-N-acetylglucosamine--LPS N-acetylglucosamine transferase [Planctomycetota bacterium]
MAKAQAILDGPDRPTKVMAIASAGGHFVQLLRCRPAWSGCDVFYVSTDAGYAPMVEPNRLIEVTDGNRKAPIAMLRSACHIAAIVWKERPDVVFSTGAAPGLLALVLGRALGARTVWLDSIANVEKMSLSGRLAGWVADLWLTQWSDLAKKSTRGVQYSGAVV